MPATPPTPCRAERVGAADAGSVVQRPKDATTTARLPHKAGGHTGCYLPHKGEIGAHHPVAPSPSMGEGWGRGGSIYSDGDY